MNKFFQLIPLTFLLLFGFKAMAAPEFMVVEGQLIDPSGHVPIEGSNVDFLLQVLSPGAEECVLFEESHTVNMTNSNGFFAIDLGDGTQSGSAFEDTNSLAAAFSNSTGPVNPSTCAAGGVYDPASTDHRKLRITFNDGSGPITIDQDVLIGANAYALSAGSVNGLTATDLLQINVGAGYSLNQANLEYVFNSTNWPELQALLDGTSSSFSVGGVPVADVDNNNQKIINVADPNPAIDSDAVNVAYARSYIGGLQVDTPTLSALAAGNNGEVLSWNGTQWTSQIANDVSKLPLTGGTMSGPLDLGNQNISNVNNLGVGNDLSVGNDLTVSGGIGVTAGINSGGNINLANETELQLAEATPNGTNYVALKSPANLANDVTLTLPSDGGSAGDVLQTDGSGGLSWYTLPVAGDFLADGSVAMTAPLRANGGTVTAPGIVFNADPNSGLYYPGPDQLGFSVAGSSALFIDNNTFIGIGTTTPQAKLDVQGSIKIGDDVSACSFLNSGTLRFDGTSYLYCDGTAWETLGGTGEANTASNIGSGSGLYYQKNGVDLEFRSLQTASSKLNISQTPDSLVFDIDESQLDPLMIPVGTTPLTATTLEAAFIELDSDKIDASRSLIAGNGLTGGGDFSSDRQIDIGAGDGIIVNADDVSVMAGEGISVDGTGVQVDILSAASETTIDPADEILIHDASTAALRRMSRQNFVLSQTEVVNYVNASNAFISNGGNSLNDSMTLGTNDNYNLNLRTNSTTAMTIDNTGNIGIGTLNPVSKLHIEEGDYKQNNYGTHSQINLSRANGSQATPNTVSAGNVLGEVAFHGRNSSGNYPKGAFLRAQVEGTYSGSQSPTSLDFGTAGYGGMPETRMTISPDGFLGLGTMTPTAQVEVRQLPGQTQLFRIADSLNTEVFNVDDQGRTRTPGSLQIGDRGATCATNTDIGQMRTSQVLNVLQVCVDLDGTLTWVPIKDTRCPAGMNKIGSVDNPDLCISATYETGSHATANSICNTNYPGSKICSQNQMTQAYAITGTPLTIGATHIVGDLVYDGGYLAVSVMGTGQPDGAPISLGDTGSSFHCCID